VTWGGDTLIKVLIHSYAVAKEKKDLRNESSVAQQRALRWKRSFLLQMLPNICTSSV